MFIAGGPSFLRRSVGAQSLLLAVAIVSLPGFAPTERELFARARGYKHLAPLERKRIPVTTSVNDQHHLVIVFRYRALP
jgi:hypothetical protein